MCALEHLGNRKPIQQFTTDTEMSSSEHRNMISPFAGAQVSGRRGYFNTNLESVRKDVECTFGIMKKRWCILDYGLQYNDMGYCEKILMVCAMLHNIMIDSDETRYSTAIVGCGRPLGDDGMWIEGSEEMEERYQMEALASSIREKDRLEAKEWASRREALAEHIEYCKSLYNNI